MNAHFPSRARALLLAALVCLVILPAEQMQAQEPKTVKYHGIRPTNAGGRQGLRNPERGWRIETVIAEPHQKLFIGPAAHLKGQVPPVYQDDWWLLDAKRYEPFGLTLVQAYCYLSECPDKPLPAEKLDLLQRSLDELRRDGLKALLRFTYEKDMNVKYGPKPEWIIKHIEQLQPVLQKNADGSYSG